MYFIGKNHKLRGFLASCRNCAEILQACKVRWLNAEFRSRRNQKNQNKNMELRWFGFFAEITRNYMIYFVYGKLRNSQELSKRA